MTAIDGPTVIRVGGWDGRFAVVPAVQALGDRAAAVVDANGDGADINVEHLRCVDGTWRLESSSGGAGDWGRSWHDGLWATHDRDARGWWLTLEPGAAEDETREPPEAGSHGWVAYVPRR